MRQIPRSPHTDWLGSRVSKQLLRGILVCPRRPLPFTKRSPPLPTSARAKVIVEDFEQLEERYPHLPDLAIQGHVAADACPGGRDRSLGEAVVTMTDARAS
jgi:hypothetical protein